MAAQPYAVEVDGVVKRFGSLRALDGATLRIRRGEVYGLVGPNGAGKTTLIRALVGVVVPDGGTGAVLGRRAPNLDVLGRVGYMTQQAALYPDLSAEENVAFFAAINGAHDGVREALEFVELWDRRGSVVSSLSGGMRTRCSLACALVHKPDLLLLDEPTVGVDPLLLVILGLLGYLLRGGGSVPAMGVVNLDDGPLGAAIASQLEQSKTVSASTMSRAAAQSKLRSGDLAGYVLLPSDFSSRAQQSRVISPEIHLEGSQPGLSQTMVQAVS